MGRNKLLLAAFVIALLALPLNTSPAIASESSCGIGGELGGGCHVANGGVTLGATHASPGNPGSAAHSAPEGGSSGGTPEPKNNDAACIHFLDCIIVSKPNIHHGHHGVTIHDLKTFKPTPGIDHMQPNGWAVIGLDANFYSAVGSELKHGKLLGKTAAVKFTPIGWHWNYGDEKSATRATAGSTWAVLGLHEFDPTPTSHIYRKKGTYVIDLGITFSAEYRYAGGAWTDVVGTITVPANKLKVTAGDASTVLVGRDCRQNPRGPGC
jgi:hypothetical protein